MSTLELNNLITTQQNRLNLFALKLTNNSEDAKDLVQETLYKVLKNKNKFQASGNLIAWMFTIMKNTFINEYRKKQKFGAYQNTLDIKKPQSTTSPYEEYQVKEITNLINGLDQQYHVPFNLYHQGYKYVEISEQLNLPLGTVKSRIFKARKKLSAQVN